MSKQNIICLNCFKNTPIDASGLADKTFSIECIHCDTTLDVECQAVDFVACDYCNQDNHTSGGFLFSSKAICPECAPNALKSIKRYSEEGYIKAYCPEDMTFHDWVVKVLRNSEPAYNLIITM